MKLRLFIPLWLVVNLIQPLRAAEAPEQEQPAATLRSTAKPKKSPEQLEQERQQAITTHIAKIRTLLAACNGSASEPRSQTKALETIKTHLGYAAGLLKLLNEKELFAPELATLTETFEQTKKELTITPLPQHLAEQQYPTSLQPLHTKSARTEDFAQFIQFPRGYSPDRGWIIVHNGFLLSILNGSKTVTPQLLTLAKTLFNEQIAQSTGRVVITGLTRNVAIALSPIVIAKLLRLLEGIPTPADLTDTYLKKLDPFLDEWHDYYGTLRHTAGKIGSPSAFRGEARDFIKLLSSCFHTNRQMTIDFLLASFSIQTEALFLAQQKIAATQMLLKTLTKQEFKPNFYHIDDLIDLKYRYSQIETPDIRTELEPLIQFLKWQIKAPTTANAILPLHNLFPSEGAYGTYRGKHFPLCGENTLRILISLLFYNPETQSLDLSVIPEKLQDEIDPQLREYIIHFGRLPNPQTSNPEEEKAYIEEAQTAWLHLVENRKGINYGKAFVENPQNQLFIRYDIEPNLKNLITLLQQLCGHSAQALQGNEGEKLIQIIGLFSTPTRKFLVTGSGNGHNGHFKIKAEFPQRDPYCPSLVFNYMHAHIQVCHKTTESMPNHRFLQHIHQAETELGLSLWGLTNAHVTNLVLSGSFNFLHTVEDYVEFFNRYTKSERPYAFPGYFYLFAHYAKNDTVESPDESSKEDSYKQMGQKVFKAMKQCGFNGPTALTEALHQEAHNKILQCLRYYSTTGHLLSDTQVVELITLIEPLTEPTLYNEAQGGFLTGCWYSRLLLEEFRKVNLDLTKNYPFPTGSQSPLAWALSTKNLYAIEHLLKAAGQHPDDVQLIIKAGVLPDDAQLVEIFQILTNFNCAKYTKNIIEALRITGVDLTRKYPFPEGKMTPAEWTRRTKAAPTIKAVLLAIREVQLQEMQPVPCTIL